MEFNKSKGINRTLAHKFQEGNIFGIELSLNFQL